MNGSCPGRPAPARLGGQRVSPGRAAAPPRAGGGLRAGRALPRLHAAGDLVVVGPPLRAGEPPEIRHHRDVLTAR